MTAAPKIDPDHVRQHAAAIVFSRSGNKARASWFPPELAPAAKRAASSMGVHFLKVSNDTARQLATKLPQGRIFDSGKAFMPLVQGLVFDELEKQLPPSAKTKLRVVASNAVARPGSDSIKGKASPDEEHRPKDWTDIKVGSVVLASESDDDGWWPCIVQEVYSKELRLKWKDFPDYEQITRGYDQVALFWSSSSTAANA